MSCEVRYVYCPALFAGNIRLLRKLQDSDYWSVLLEVRSILRTLKLCV